MKKRKRIVIIAAGAVVGAMLLGGTGETKTAAANSCVGPPSGLVSWWAGDGDATDIVNGNDGTLQGGATFTLGQVGDAFLLDGIDDFVDLSNASNLHVSGGDFTVDAWVLFNDLDHPPGGNTSAPQGDMSIVDKMAGTGVVNSDGWRLIKQNDNRFWFCLGGGGSNGCIATGQTTVRSTTVVSTADLAVTWFHVAIVKDSTNLSIYINGMQEQQKLLPSFTDTNSANLFIGSNVREGAHLNGLVDEVEIYNRALSGPEVQEIFNAGAAGKCKFIEAQIDIKPDSDQNSVNLRSRGVIPVAILTTDDFDATTVDPLSIQFGPDGATEAHGNGHIEDADGDGDLDFILHFKTQETGVQCGDTQASLTGETFGGQMIEGTDSINAVGCS